MNIFVVSYFDSAGWFLAEELPGGWGAGLMVDSAGWSLIEELPGGWRAGLMVEEKLLGWIGAGL